MLRLFEKKLLMGVLVAGMGMSSGKIAHAAVELRGFGTAGMTRCDSRFCGPISIREDSKTFDFERLTRFGLNAFADLNDGWSVSSQFLARSKVNSFNNMLSWGFVSWRPNQRVNFKAGRIVAPVWLFSQQIDVGYSLTWIQPPDEVYGLNPISSINGASLFFQEQLGAGFLRAELVTGMGNNLSEDRSYPTPSSTSADVRNFYGLDLRYNLDDRYLFRASYFRGDVNVFRLGLNSAAVVSQPGGTTTVYNTTVTQVDTRVGQLFSLGFKMDQKNVLVLGEVARRLVSGTALMRAAGAYGTVGYRWHSRFLSHLTYAWQGENEGFFSVHPDYPNVTAQQKNADSWIYGLNYTASESVILKAGYTRSRKFFTDPRADLRYNVYQLALDFVF